jgi:hypothetical protein
MDAEKAAADGSREVAMQDRRSVSLFRKAILRKERNRSIREPMPRQSLLEMLSGWGALNEEFPEIDDLEPVEDVSL